MLTLKVWPQFHRKAKRTHTHVRSRTQTPAPSPCCLCLCVSTLCSDGLLLLCCESFFVVRCSSFLGKGETAEVLRGRNDVTCAVCSVMRQYVKLFIEIFEIDIAYYYRFRNLSGEKEKAMGNVSNDDLWDLLLTLALQPMLNSVSRLQQRYEISKSHPVKHIHSCGSKTCQKTIWTHL